jgi:hypothetical protein
VVAVIVPRVIVGVELPKLLKFVDLVLELTVVIPLLALAKLLKL